MLGALWLLQRRLTRGAAGRDKRQPVRVIAKQGLGAKTSLVVVEVDDTRYVLGVSERGVSVLDRLPADAAAASQPAPTTDAGDLPAPLPLRRTLHHGSRRALGA